MRAVFTNRQFVKAKVKEKFLIPSLGAWTLRLWTLFLFSCFFYPSSFAQDIHFSQFYASPLTLNPANTGNYIGDWRFCNSLRNQWNAIVKKKGYQTVALSYDQQFYVFNERISGGIAIVNDRSGPWALNASKMYVTGGYHKTVEENNLHFGFQAGYITKDFKTEGLTFPGQYDDTKGSFDPSLSGGPSGEKKSYLDVNIGAIWSRKFGKYEPEAGIALYHVNYPKESLIDNEQGRLPMRKVFHVGGKIELTEKFFVMPNILVMLHKKANEFLEGGNLAYRLPKNSMKIQHVYSGFLLRNGIARNMDAAIGVIGVQFPKLNVGLSYDVNISSLETSTHYRGGYELSIIYIGPSTLLQNVSVPCDRD